MPRPGEPVLDTGQFGTVDGGDRELGRREQRRARRKARRSIFWRLRRFFYLLVVLGVSLLSGVAWILNQLELPDDSTVATLAQTSFVCAADVTSGCGPDNALVKLNAEEDRSIVSFEQLPDVLVQAVLVAEDRDFFTHGGIDPQGIARAAWVDIRNEGVTQGGSTITQQYVKNAFLTSERTLIRKLREAVLAVKLERQLSKEEILTRYLNAIYFGRGAYGVQAASREYFGKDVEDIGLAEAAYLAALIRAPERADAYRYPDVASRRRLSVLTGMLEEEYIDQATLERVDAIRWEEPYVLPRVDNVGLGAVRGSECATEYFASAVLGELLELYQTEVFTAGLRVYTTLDHELQCMAYETVTSTLPGPEDPAASIVSVDGRGHVVAMMGGVDFDRSQVNLALGVEGGGSGRQPGSAFKPLVLAEALAQGYSARSKFPAPRSQVFPRANAGADWKVSGGGSSTGIYDLVDATRVSSNTVYAQLMLEVGPDNVVALAHRMGVTAELPPVPALVLGSGDVSVLDMASAYSTLANRGEHVEPVLITRIEDAAGELVWTPDRSYERVLEPEVVDAVTTVLKQVIARGTGRRAAFERDAAGKTGTTQDYRDAWFVGYTCDLTTAVWMGHVGEPGEPPRFMDDVQGQGEVTGGSFPAQMWGEYMARATADDAPCVLPTTNRFSGRVLNSHLQPTTTLVPCDSTTEPLPPSTEPDQVEPVTTLAPCEPVEPAPDPTGGAGSPTSAPPPAPSVTEPDPISTQPVPPVTEPSSTTTVSVPPDTEPPETTQPDPPRHRIGCYRGLIGTRARKSGRLRSEGDPLPCRS